LLVSVAVSFAAGQGVIVPVRTERAFLVNQTGKPVRFVVSSALGVHTMVLPNNAAAATFFQGKRTRVITVYDTTAPGAPPVVNEPIDLVADTYYQIQMPLAAPPAVMGAPSRLKPAKTAPEGVRMLPDSVPGSQP
jgi:hypothetical protein